MTAILETAAVLGTIAAGSQLIGASLHKAMAPEFDKFNAARPNEKYHYIAEFSNTLNPEIFSAFLRWLETHQSLLPKNGPRLTTQDTKHTFRLLPFNRSHRIKTKSGTIIMWIVASEGVPIMFGIATKKYSSFARLWALRWCKEWKWNYAKLLLFLQNEVTRCKFFDRNSASSIIDSENLEKLVKKYGNVLSEKKKRREKKWKNPLKFDPCLPEEIKKRIQDTKR